MGTPKIVHNSRRKSIQRAINIGLEYRISSRNLSCFKERNFPLKLEMSDIKTLDDKYYL